MSGGRVWSSAAELLAKLREHRGEVSAAAFTADGGRYVTAGLDGLARVYPGDVAGVLAIGCGLLRYAPHDPAVDEYCEPPSE